MSRHAEPLPIACSGCGELTPYRVGEDASYGEWLATPLGLCYARTHRRRECVVASRARLEGRKVTLGPTKQERAKGAAGADPS